MRMNLNEYVWVKLTKAGERAYAITYATEIKPETERGFARFQMHELMYVFGPHHSPSSNPMFEDNEIHFSPPL